MRPVACCLLAGVLMAGRISQASEADARQSRSMTDDVVRGRDLIQRMIRHLGGESVLNTIERVHVLMEGDVFNGLQGFDPADIDSTKRIGGAVLEADFDFAGHRYRRRSLQTLPGNINLEAVTYWADGQTVTIYPKGHHSSRAAVAESTVADGLLRQVPTLFAQRALKNIGSATFVGEYSEGNRRVAMVDVSLDLGSRVRAHVDVADGALLAIESWAPDPLIGDDRVFYRFAGERSVDGVAFPERVTVERRGRRYVAFTVGAVAVNPRFDPELFVPVVSEPLQSESVTAALGGGAYEIRGLEGGVFRIVFFDLGDGVAVFDAPESRARSKAIAAEIHKTVGNKPIKYVIASHFHDDHMAGIGYYVDQGATIVTARANAPVIARYAVADSRVRPDLKAEGKLPSFIYVDGSNMTLGDPGHAIVIYRLPTCPHAKDMLIVYVPSEKLAVEADLFVELAGTSDASADFVRWLRQPGAPRVDWIVGSHFRKTAVAALHLN